jgi:anti-sigma factor RsiW
MAELRSSHPNDEWLVAYLTTGLSDHERHGLDAHLQGCDLCVETLSMMQRRLSMASTVSTPVPASVRERVTALNPSVDSFPVSQPLPPGPSLPAWLSSVLDHLATVSRLQLLAPVAVAAVALLVVVTQSNWMNPVPQQERSRSITTREPLRVTASEAHVWQGPGTTGRGAEEADIIATLKRGARVDIVGEKDQWYQVVLADGKEGWMERHAFE